MARNQCGASTTWSATASLVPLLEPRPGESVSAARRCAAGQPLQRGISRPRRIPSGGGVLGGRHIPLRSDGYTAIESLLNPGRFSKRGWAGRAKSQTVPASGPMRTWILTGRPGDGSSSLLKGRVASRIGATVTASQVFTWQSLPSPRRSRCLGEY